MSVFVVYPAIDLRNGQVVRLSEGDPERQTVYTSNHAETAGQFLESGAEWLHVINLDGAFGLEDEKNLCALAAILKVAGNYHGKLQFGGGLRSLASIEKVFNMGVNRIILGTAVIEMPDLLDDVLERWGTERLAIGLDARDGLLRTRGWQDQTRIEVTDVAVTLQQKGVRTVIVTDIARDGLLMGPNLALSQKIAKPSGLNVIASGGVGDLADVEAVKNAGLNGVIVGRAIYEKRIQLMDLFRKDKH